MRSQDPSARASLIDTGVAAGPAYVLTAGRCVGGEGRSAQSTTIGAPWAGSAEFLRVDGERAATVSVDVAEIAYATMRHVDLAILRLDSTLGELQSYGLEPLAIADQEPRGSADVVAVGVAPPHWGDAAGMLHRSDCALGERHTVIEASWLWFDVWSADCPVLEEGFVGSPLLSGGDRDAPGEIVAVAGTSAVGIPSPGGACARGRPCRLEESGAVRVVPTSYAQDVIGLGRLLRAVDRAVLLRLRVPAAPVGRVGRAGWWSRSAAEPPPTRSGAHRK